MYIYMCIYYLFIYDVCWLWIPTLYVNENRKRGKKKGKGEEPFPQRRKRLSTKGFKSEQRQEAGVRDRRQRRKRTGKQLTGTGRSGLASGAARSWDASKGRSGWKKGPPGARRRGGGVGGGGKGGGRAGWWIGGRWLAAPVSPPAPVGFGWRSACLVDVNSRVVSCKRVGVCHDGGKGFYTPCNFLFFTFLLLGIKQFDPCRSSKMNCFVIYFIWCISFYISYHLSILSFVIYLMYFIVSYFHLSILVVLLFIWYISWYISILSHFTF